MWCNVFIVFGDIGDKRFVNWCYIVCYKSWVCCGVFMIGFSDVYIIVRDDFIDLVGCYI